MISAWGYLHKSGEILTKMYTPLSSEVREDAKASPFVRGVSEVYTGKTLDEAFGQVRAELDLLKEQLEKKG